MACAIGLSPIFARGLFRQGPQLQFDHRVGQAAKAEWVVQVRRFQRPWYDDGKLNSPARYTMSYIDFPEMADACPERCLADTHPANLPSEIQPYNENSTTQLERVPLPIARVLRSRSGPENMHGLKV